MTLFFSIVISSVGFAYFIYGKRNSELVYMVDGVAMMLYPYFVGNLLISVIIGIVLCTLPFILKRYGL